MIYFKSLIFLFLFSFLSGAEIVSGQAIQLNIQGVPSSEQQRINGIYPIAEDGNIRMWKIGEIQAVGLKFNDLSKKIEKSYQDLEIYSSPNIQILSNSDAKIKTYMITVGGRVRKPGPISYYKGIKLYEAIAGAGGIDPYGASHRIELYRKEEETRKFDLDDSKHKHEVLLPGDILEVPEKNWLGR